MNAIFWLFNGLLAVLAILLTVAVVQFHPKVPTAGGSSATEARGGVRKPDVAARAAVPETQSRRLLGSAKLDPLWQNSLFLPARSEDTSDATVGTASDAGVKNSEMELIGFASMGTEAAAIIALPDRDKVAPKLATKPGQRPGDLAAKPPPRAKRVFKVGETVLDTGFTVKAIRLEEVVLGRGEEERILKLDRNSPNSKNRAEQARREAANRLPPAVPAPTPSSANIPVPPPPPPLPMPAVGVPGGNAAANTPAAREERLRQAIEARRQMLDSAKQKP